MYCMLHAEKIKALDTRCDLSRLVVTRHNSESRVFFFDEVEKILLFFLFFYYFK